MNALLVGLNGHVVALQPHTGDMLWKVDLCGQGLVTFAVNDSLVVASGTNDVLVGIDRSTGQERFRVKTSSFGKATVLLEHDRVFVVKAGVLECFGLDGQQRWREGFAGMGNRSVSLALGHQVVLADDT
ncbi:MAG: PQQ-binding-like beta-propeller repeat protein [Myxococcaceae bacterium]|nr:PQQ-binding-like beta-propeller repeat protein [Myxococcaceae bacterium]